MVAVLFAMLALMIVLSAFLPNYDVLGANELPLISAIFLMLAVLTSFEVRRIEMNKPDDFVLIERYTAFGTKRRELPLSALQSIVSPKRRILLQSGIDLVFEDERLELAGYGVRRFGRAYQRMTALADTIASFTHAPLETRES
ncbi:MAG: hypothetical protein AAF719_12020 [Pseudomonadota bacterium]